MHKIVHEAKRPEAHPQLTRGQAPPASYYRDNCNEAFDFVFSQYQEMLPQHSLCQLNAYLGCSQDSQRLFARLLTRKGPLFRVDSLSYLEVGNINTAIEELTDSRLISDEKGVPADVVLGLLTKKELKLMWPYLDAALLKNALCLRLVGRYSDKQIVEAVQSNIPFIKLYDRESWSLFEFLYFGNEFRSWSEFVVRDLGIASFESPASTARQFVSEDDMTSHLGLLGYASYARRLDEFSELGGYLVERLRRPQTNLVSNRKRTRILNRIAKWGEKNKHFKLACDAYRLIDQHPARERLVRINHKLGEIEERDELLSEIHRAPLSEEEEQFAQRFGKRNAGYNPETTVVELEPFEGSVERAVLGELTKKSGWGVHSENSLLKSLTGIAYWEPIHLPVPGAFTNPFQSGPHDLFEPDFVSARGKEIRALEERLEQTGELKAHIVDVAEKKCGVYSSLVNWRLFEKFPVTDFVDAIGPEDLLVLLSYFVRHLGSRRKGFPDLFISYPDDTYEFVEVKGPGDQLSLSQRVWLQRLESMSIPSRVVKVKLPG